MRSWRAWDAASAREREDVRACKAAVLSIIPDSQVILYGSRARGDARSESDFDLLVLAPTDVSQEVQQELSDALFDVELEREIIVSCLVVSRDQWHGSPWRAAPLHANVEREGIAL